MKTYICQIKNNQLVCPELHKDLAAKGAQGLEVEVTIEKVGEKRSNKQNRYLWKPVYKPLVEFYQKNNGALLLDLMEAVKIQINAEFIHWMFKLMYNKGRSTRRMRPARFNEFFNDIREYVWHKHQIDIPLPNQPPMEDNNAPIN